MTRRTSYHKISAALVAAVTTIVVAGCGNTPPPSGGGVVKPAGASTATAHAAGTSKGSAASGAATGSAGKLGRDLFTKTYVAALKAGTAHVSMTIGGGISSVGDVVYTASNPSMTLTMRTPQTKGAMQMRLVDHVLYMQIPGATPAGKFLAIDSRDSTSPLGKAFGSTISQMNPLASLRASQGAVTAVTFVGHEQVQGTMADRYRVTLDTAKAMSAVKTQLPKATLASLPPTIDYDVWLDGADLMRRLEYQISNVMVVMELSRWGAPVHVSAPPAGSVLRQPGA